MKINRIDIDLSKSVALDDRFFMDTPMKYLIVRTKSIAHFYNTFSKEEHKALVEELKSKGAYMSEKEVSIYSQEGFINTLDYLYEYSVTETYTMNDCVTNNIEPNGVFDIILN